MARSSGDVRALSYHDVLLRKADVDLLRGPHWLNDQIIAFNFEYLMHEVHPSLAKAVALIPGAMSFLLLNSDPTEAAMIFEALQLHEKELVVFAVNDNPDVEAAAGGAHWSCLAYHRGTNTFRHYDSAKPHNREVARGLAGAAAPLVRSKSSSSGAALLPSFVDVESAPQQQNCNDCGMFVLAVARALCDSCAQGRLAAGLTEQQEAARLQHISPSGVAAMRGELLDTISSMAAAGS